jgi:adenosylmethionine-8-amino-7-oxononanoate aminotransferase
MLRPSLEQLDLNVNWHPCSQMKDYEIFKPLQILKAKGSYITLSDGKKSLIKANRCV